MKTKPGYKLFGARVPITLHRELKAEAARRGVSLASLVEAALTAYLKGKRGSK